MKTLDAKIHIDMAQFGQYTQGLTTSEIKDYLRQRAGVTRIGNLYRKFCTIAGVNTVGIGKCKFCGTEFSLMYRWDVERFTSVLLDKQPTYWD